ncbi:MAG: hypothetical protein ACYC0X_26525 [Pirellulaceae bacterium]
MALFDWLRRSLERHSTDELDPARLPHWARVAFAARCARYVQPSFASLWPDADSEHIQSLEEALTYAEESAAKARPNGDPKPFLMKSLIAAGASLRKSENSSLAASATRVAVEAIADGIDASAFKALEALSFASEVVQRSGQASLVASMHDDLRVLINYCHANRLDDASPVSPDVFAS